MGREGAWTGNREQLSFTESELVLLVQNEQSKDHGQDKHLCSKYNLCCSRAQELRLHKARARQPCCFLRVFLTRCAEADPSDPAQPCNWVAAPDARVVSRFTCGI